MKATGIVRRIDELGRLVIPKEIRRSLRIRESDPIEIYTDRDGTILLRKYARMRELSDEAGSIVQALNGTFGVNAAVTDMECALALSGARKSNYLEQPLTEGYRTTIRKRQSLFHDDTTPNGTMLFESQDAPFLQLAAVPVIASGDPVGSLILFADEKRERFGQAQIQTLKAFSLYLGKLLED